MVFPKQGVNDNRHLIQGGTPFSIVIPNGALLYFTASRGTPDKKNSLTIEDIQLTIKSV